METTKIIERLTGCGGKSWTKESLNRIYISKESFIKFAAENKLSCVFVGGLHSAIKRISTTDSAKKAWYNINDNKFESKKVSIQCFFDTYTNKEI